MYSEVNPVGNLRDRENVTSLIYLSKLICPLSGYIFPSEPLAVMM